MSTSRARLVREAAGSTAGTCHRTPRPPRNRNCTKDYVNSDNDFDDIDAAAVAEVDNNDTDTAAVIALDGDIGKDVGYGARTSWSPTVRWLLAVKSGP
jgi:hypothetical protein